VAFENNAIEYGLAATGLVRSRHDISLADIRSVMPASGNAESASDPCFPLRRDRLLVG
jgi:hypothetical protein